MGVTSVVETDGSFHLPNHKTQTNLDYQITNAFFPVILNIDETITNKNGRLATESCTRMLLWSLGFGIYLEFGIWNLRFHIRDNQLHTAKQLRNFKTGNDTFLAFGFTLFFVGRLVHEII